MDIGAYEASVSIDAGAVVIHGSNASDAITLHADGVTIDSNGGEKFTVDFNTASSITVYALDGDDVVTAAADFPKPITVYGGHGADHLQGAGYADTLYGDAGDDVIFGGAGADTVHGGDQADLIYGEGGVDLLYGEGGYDEIDKGDSTGDTVELGSGQKVGDAPTSVEAVFAYLGTPSWQWSFNPEDIVRPSGGTIDIGFEVHNPNAFKAIDPINGWLDIEVTDDLGVAVPGFTVGTQVISFPLPGNATGTSNMMDYSIDVIDETNPSVPVLFSSATVPTEELPTSPSSNAAPQIDSISAITTRKDQGVGIRLTATDDQDKPEELEYSGLSITPPAGSTVPNWPHSSLSADGVFRLNPEGFDVGTYTINFTVEDSDAATANGSFQVTLEDYNEAPPNTFLAPNTTSNPPLANTFSTSTSTPFTKTWNLAYFGSIDSQTPNSQLTFTLEGDAPTGMSLDSLGILTWTYAGNFDPTQKHVWQSEIVITDTAVGSSSARSVRIPLISRVLHTEFDPNGGLNGNSVFIYTGEGGAVDDQLRLGINAQTPDYPLSHNVREIVAEDLDSFLWDARYNVVSEPQHAQTGFGVDDTSGIITYIPLPDGEGLDQFTYQIESSDHTVSGYPGPDEEYTASTGNTAPVLIEVGQALRADIDINSPEFNPDAKQESTPWHTYDASADDDSEGYVGIGERVPLKLGYWLRDDAYITDFTARISGGGANIDGVRLWDAPTDGNEIFLYNRVQSNGVWKTGGTEWILDGDQGLPETIYVEGVKNGTLSLTFEVDGPQTALFTDIPSFNGGQAEYNEDDPNSLVDDSDSITLIVGPSLTVTSKPEAPTCVCECTCSNSPKEDTDQSSGETSVSASAGAGVQANYTNPNHREMEAQLSFTGADFTAMGGSTSQPGTFALNLLLDDTDPQNPVVTQPVTFPIVAPPGGTDPDGIYRAPVTLPVIGTEPGYYNYSLSSTSHTHHGDDFYANNWLPILKHGDYGFGDGWNVAGIERLIARPDSVGASDMYWIRADNDILEFPTESFVFDGDGEFVSGQAKHDRNATVVTKDDVTGGFTLTDKYENETHFDSAGWITKRVDPYGNETIYLYVAGQSGHKIDRVETTIDGQETTFHWDAGYTQVEEIEDFAGRFTLLHRGDVANPHQLTKIELPDPDTTSPAAKGGGPENTFAYDGAGRLTSFTDADNVTTSYEYSHDGQVIKTTYGDGTADEASTTLVISETGFFGSAFALTSFEASQMLDGFSTSNRTGSFTDELERTTKFETDDNGYITKLVDPTGRVTEYDRNSVGQSLETRLYDAQGTLVDQTSYDYDADFNLTSTTYYDVSSGTPVAIAGEQYAFDSFGRPLSYLDELGREVKIDYHTGDQHGDGAAKQVTTRVVVGLDDTTSSETDDLVTDVHYLANGLVEKTIAHRIDYDGTLQDAIETHYFYTDPTTDVTGDPLNILAVKAVATVVAGNVVAYVTTTRFDDFGNAEEINELVDIVGTVDLDLTGNLTGGGSNDVLRTTQYEYDRLDRVTKITLPNPDATVTGDQSIVRFEYTPTGRIENEIQSYDGLTPGAAEEITTHYVYDNRHRLKHEIYNFNSSTIASGYETAASLGSPSADDVENVAVSYAYDDAGNVTSVTDPLGRVTSFEYDLLNRAIRITEADPDSGGSLLSPVSYLAYDAVGRLLAERDAGGDVTRYAYDARHRVTDIYAPLGARAQFSYDAASQLIATTDAEGRETAYTYDDAGRVAEVRLPGQQQTPLTYQYDTLSNTRIATDQLGREMVYEYDNQSRLDKTIANYVDGVTSSTSDEDIVTTFSYQDDGLLSSVSETIGWDTTAVTRSTSYAYDGAGRLKTLDLPTVGSSSPQLHRLYDSFGNLQYDVDQLGNVTEYQYDKLHRLTKVVQEDPDAASGRYSGGVVSAATGTHPETTYRYDAASQLLDVTDPVGRKSSYKYDDLGRVTEAWSPDVTTLGRGVHDVGFDTTNTPVTKYAYDAEGNVLTTRDAGDEGSDYAYDALDRLISETVTDTTGGSTTYAYDRVGNLLSLTDPVQNTTTWAYDELDRVTSETNQLGHSRTFAYDTASRLTSKLDRNGRRTDYAYDAADRLVSEQWFADAQDTSADHTLDFTYDHLGRMLTSTDAAHDYSYTLDARDRVTQRDLKITGLEEEVRFESAYDSADRKSWVTAKFVDGGLTTSDYGNFFSYDNLHRLKAISQLDIGGHAIAEKHVDLAYNLSGQLESLTRFDQSSFVSYDSTHNTITYEGASGAEVATTAYDYDHSGRLDKIEHFAGDDTNPATGTLLAGYGYTFDNRDRLDAIDFLPGNAGYTSPFDYSAEDVTYTYDDRNQLTGADLAGMTNDESYQYDENGNRELADGSTYTTDDDNRLESDGTYRYQYDNEGNRTRRYKDNNTNQTFDAGDTDITKYEWDHRNRLIKVTDYAAHGGLSTQVVDHVYDAENRWIGQTIDHDGDSGAAAIDQVFRVYDGGQVVFKFEKTGAGAVTKDDLTERYLWGPAVDQLLAVEQVESLSDASQNTTLWAATDHLGTVRDLLEYDDATSTTELVAHIAYDTFGRIVSVTDAVGATLSASPIDVGFTGKILDIYTGLQNNWNRWYDATVGRWISEDPIGFEGGDVNLSRYVGNQVTTYVDVNGLSWFNKIKGVVVDGGDLIINGVKKSRVRNFQFAGKSVTLNMLEEMTGVAKDRIKRLRDKYGDDLCIKFDKDGFPDFSDFKKAEVNVKGLKGKGDSSKAWDALEDTDPELFMQLQKQKKHLEFHHVDDETMILVDKDLHKAFAHTGPASGMRGALIGLGFVLIAPGTSELYAATQSNPDCLIDVSDTEVIGTGIIDVLRWFDPFFEDAFRETHNREAARVQKELDQGYYTLPVGPKW